MSADQFLALGETVERLELIDGVVIVSPSPHPRHQRTVQELFRQLDRQLLAQRHADVYIDTDIRFNDSTVYRPDASVFAAGRLPTDPDVLRIAPDLIIEVLSPTNKPLDLVTKRDQYDRFGVAEYVVFDPDTGRFRRWSRQGPHLTETPAEGDTLRSVAFPSLTLDLAAVRNAARPR